MLLTASIVAALDLASGSASAADGSEAYTPVRGVPVPVPLEAPHRRPTTLPAATAPGMVFVNFDGAELSWGWDDAGSNTSQIWEMAGTFAPYGDDPMKRAAVMQAVREDWAPYAVTITDTRPLIGEYTMCMVGPTNPFGQNVLGIAPLDCSDGQTHGNITYAFHSANDGMAATTAATTIGQEVAHSYGLEHVDDPTDVMNPYNNGGDPWFHDECIPIVGDVICGAQHEVGCGTATMQNAHAELLALFGAAAPDTEPPQVAIVSPADGDVFEVGTDFPIDVEASDAGGVAEVRLWLGEELHGSDDAEPLGWFVSKAPAGEYVFTVEAVDLAGNQAFSEQVIVRVGDEPAEPDGDAGTIPGDADGGDPIPDGDGPDPDDDVDTGDDVPATDDASEDPAEPEVPMDPELPGYADDDPFGFACAVDRGREGGVGVLSLLLVALAGGRRRRA